MIKPPQRSVTRFFIPLIDVLTLLFCVFLVMPLARPGDGKGLAALTPEERRFKDLEDKLLRAEDALRQKNSDLEAALNKKTTDLKTDVFMRLLEADKKGRLYYHDRGRIPIDEFKAQELIKQDRLRQGSTRQLYYLILSPRDSNLSDVDMKKYEDWFRGATVGEANSFSSPGSEK